MGPVPTFCYAPAQVLSAQGSPKISPHALTEVPAQPRPDISSSSKATPPAVQGGPGGSASVGEQAVHSSAEPEALPSPALVSVSAALSTASQHGGADGGGVSVTAAVPASSKKEVPAAQHLSETVPNGIPASAPGMKSTADPCWLRPTLRPNRKLRIRSKYDSGSDTDVRAAKSCTAKVPPTSKSKAGIQPTGAAPVVKPRSHKAKAEDSDDECRWGVRRNGPRARSWPYLGTVDLAQLVPLISNSSLARIESTGT